MRKLGAAVCLFAIVAAVVAGIVQTRNSERAIATAPEPLSRPEVTKPIAGAPAELAALRARVSELRPGGKQALEAQLRALRGYPVVVNIWASWCDPCRYELPFFQRQAVKRGARVAFLGVNSDDAPDAARSLADEFPMPYPSFVDERQAVAGSYGARGLPVTAFYDARGRRAIVHQGQFPTEASLAEAIERYALR